MPQFSSRSEGPRLREETRRHVQRQNQEQPIPRVWAGRPDEMVPKSNHYDVHATAIDGELADNNYFNKCWRIEVKVSVSSQELWKEKKTMFKSSTMTLASGHFDLCPGHRCAASVRLYRSTIPADDEPPFMLFVRRVNGALAKDRLTHADALGAERG
jgi:hypothetical protein